MRPPAIWLRFTSIAKAATTAACRVGQHKKSLETAAPGDSSPTLHQAITAWPTKPVIDDAGLLPITF